LLDLVVVENVGNLVCPAEFEVGEHANVALLSVTEGEDKPLKYPVMKYPVMFREANCLLITKTDLAPYLDVALFIRCGSRSDRGQCAADQPPSGNHSGQCQNRRRHRGLVDPGAPGHGAIEPAERSRTSSDHLI
jgi:hypothetical protein